MGIDHSRWKNADGDNTHALEWPIDEHATVWEIGGFEGRWASQISEKFNPWIRIFEPTRWGFGKCSARFLGNEKVEVNHYGLWVMDASLPVYNPGNDGASLLMSHVTSEVCPFHDIYTELQDEVDLCLMNVEGSEYILLPYLIGNHSMPNFRFFWCQFHPFADPTGERFLRIHEGLKRTHRMIWDFYPSAVAWERK